MNSLHTTDSPWGCEPFHYGQDTFPPAQRGMARVVVVDRGDCYFVEKVRVYMKAPRTRALRR